MTDQPSEEIPELGLGKPQPLAFQFITDDGQVAIHEALIVDCQKPGSPVLGLTVTVASSLQRESGPQVQAFLSKLRAAFAVLPEPPPDDGGPDADQPVDGEPDTDQPGEGVRGIVRFRLASFTGPQPAGIAVTVGTADEPVPPQAESDTDGHPPIHPFMPYHLGAGLSDRWHSDSNGTFTAYVTASIGTGTLSSPGKQSKPLSPGQPRSMSGKVVVVTASGGASLTYSLTGSGRLMARH